MNVPTVLTDPSGYRTDEVDTDMFVHVFDGVLRGQHLEVQRLIEHMSSHIMMRMVWRLEQLESHIFFLDKVIVTQVVATRQGQVRSTHEM